MQFSARVITLMHLWTYLMSAQSKSRMCALEISVAPHRAHSRRGCRQLMIHLFTCLFIAARAQYARNKAADHRHNNYYLSQYIIIVYDVCILYACSALPQHLPRELLYTHLKSMFLRSCIDTRFI